MKITYCYLENFRSIAETDFFAFPYMVFVGKNNSGKSNLLKGLDVFFNGGWSADDFRKDPVTGVPAKKIHIEVEFQELSDAELDIFEECLLSDEPGSELLVLRLILKRGKKIDYNYECLITKIDKKKATEAGYGWFFNDDLKKTSRLENNPNVPEEFKKMAFDLLDEKEKNGKRRRLYKRDLAWLRSQYREKYNLDEKIGAKKVWEDCHITSRNREEKLGNFFFVPAVQDIEKETTYSARGKTNINNLMNFILDKMQDPDKEKKHKDEIQGILDKIYQTDKEDSPLKKLESQLNSTLNEFDSSHIKFQPELPRIDKLIRDSLRVYINDGVETEVQYKGHGLQRFFMIALFKVWAEKVIENRKDPSSSKKGKITTGSAYFAIEEPELFLHPQYQRMMRDYLLTISEMDDNQILLNSHSPNFIEFDYAEEIAKVYKRDTKSGTKVVQPINIEETGKIQRKQLINVFGDDPRRRKKFEQINKLNMNYFLNPDRNEMFFADKVVLVEGQTEKMMFQAWGNYFFGEDPWLTNKITYVDCIGKYNIQNYIKLLDAFEIPFVVIWDSDSDKGVKPAPINYHIKKDAEDAGGSCFTLEPDFEREFNITDAEYGTDDRKKHKPYYAFKKFFSEDGTPKEDELKILSADPKLSTIFENIYGRSI